MRKRWMQWCVYSQREKFNGLRVFKKIKRPGTLDKALNMLGLSEVVVAVYPHHRPRPGRTKTSGQWGALADIRARMHHKVVRHYYESCQ